VTSNDRTDSRQGHCMAIEIHLPTESQGGGRVLTRPPPFLICAAQNRPMGIIFGSRTYSLPATWPQLPFSATSARVGAGLAGGTHPCQRSCSRLSRPRSDALQRLRFSYAEASWWDLEVRQRRWCRVTGPIVGYRLTWSGRVQCRRATVYSARAARV
jgi:hypothetical protein